MGLDFSGTLKTLSFTCTYFSDFFFKSIYTDITVENKEQLNIDQK
jgi:hypothetical protein